MTTEKISTLQIEEAFSLLERRLLDEGSKTISRNSPSDIRVEHGSDWSFSLKMIKKRVRFYLNQHKEGTRVVAETEYPLASEVILVFIMIGILSGAGLWALSSYWAFSELSPWEQILDPSAGDRALVGAIFLFGLVLIAVLLELVSYAKKDSFAEALLRTLP